MRLPSLEPNKTNSIIEDFIWIDACMHLVHVGDMIYIMGAGYAAIHLWARRAGKGSSVIHFVADKLYAAECWLIGKVRATPCAKKSGQSV